MLAGIHVSLPEQNPNDPDSIYSDVWEQLPPALLQAEADEIADDIRRLRQRPALPHPPLRRTTKRAFPTTLVLRILALATLVLALVLLGACGTTPSSRAMTVVGTEMAFDAPRRVPAGHYEVTFRNEGLVAHELAFRGPDGEFVNRISIGAAQSQVVDVDLEPGTWVLGCYEPGHFEAGMHESLVVDPG